MLAEVFLGAVLQVLFDRLAPRELMSLVFRESVKKKLEKWRQTLSAIQMVLKDAEEKQLTDEDVKQWLEAIRDLAYDLEDLFDDFAIEAVQRKLKAEPESGSPASMVRNLVPPRFTPSAVKFNLKMKFEIEKISKRLKEITEQKDRLGLKDGGMSVKIWKRPSSTSVPYGPVIGRDEDRKKIIELILKDEQTDDANFHVISIVGMAGVGKTTLARLVYNDDAVKHFNPRAWICVSDDFDVMMVTKALLESVTSQPCHLKELNEVQVKLASELEGKKFLLVLDDLWNENYGLWEALLPPFSAGAAGSRIIVTTRNASVGKVMGAVQSYNLDFISDNDCWTIFVQHSLMNENVGRPGNSGLIRERILERCRGLPLAARTLGGLFRGKELDEWEDIMNGKLWSSSNMGSDIFPILRLSYHHLPHHLKRCFAYCSLFPRDYEFEEKQLILLWMAEGLIYQAEGDKPMEDLGGEYFRDLLSRSFFQQSSSNKSRFVMHDLISDLAQWVAGISYFRLETKLEGNERSKVSRKARHLSFVGSRYDGAKKFEAISEFKHLRTFLPLMAPYVGYSYLSYHIINQLLPKLQNLRVLSLSGYRIVYLPETIGDLKHLRYLDLSRTQLRSLPASISTLYNLQTLLLENCSSLKFLPPDFGKLFNLRHLNIFGSNLLEGMPLSIGNLTSLQTLSNFVVGKADSFCVIRELGPLVHLRGTLCISKLENVTKAQEARDSYLYGKQDLNEIVMEWSSNLNESQDEETQLEVLNMLQPNVKLKELTVKCYGGTKFPTWIGDPSFSNLVLLRFENCDNCNSLPPVGQLPFLKDLLIKGMAGVKSVGREFYGESCSRPFQSLETLHFENMPRWENWTPLGVNEAFACLRKLSIIRCHNLVRKLPGHLPLLKKLVIHGCWNLVVSVSNLPMLCVLVIEGCKRVECESSVGFGSPYSMAFSKISEFGNATAGLMHGVSKVEYLKIVDSEKLTTLWEKIPEGLHRLKFLRELSIEDCPTLVSFPASGFPSMLKVIQIKSCSSLKSLLPEGTLHSRENACLEKLCVVRCDSMKSIARGQLPTTLKRLEISHCMNLQCVLDEGEGSSSSSVMHDEDINNRSKTHLQYLDIKSCPSLTTLTSSGKLPATLTHLLLRECPKLMCLSSTGKLPAALQYLEIQSISKLQKIAERLHQNTSLECIKIWNCHGLKSFPEDLHNLSKLRQFQILWCQSFSSFPAAGLPSNLRVLGIKNCKNLKALPNGMRNLTSLQKLDISNRLDSLPSPLEGLPTNLIELNMIDLKLYKPMFEWGLQQLTSLIKLSIHGECLDVDSFPGERENGVMMLLPNSLSILCISYFQNLECLSPKGFQNLTSLNQLKIYNCLKLTSLPKEGLPPSLTQLEIRNCPLLSQHCNSEKAQEWSKIAHIPCVLIDNKFIHETVTTDSSTTQLNR